MRSSRSSNSLSSGSATMTSSTPSSSALSASSAFETTRPHITDSVLPSSSKVQALAALDWLATAMSRKARVDAKSNPPSSSTPSARALTARSTRFSTSRGSPSWLQISRSCIAGFISSRDGRSESSTITAFTSPDLKLLATMSFRS